MLRYITEDRTKKSVSLVHSLIEKNSHNNRNRFHAPQPSMELTVAVGAGAKAEADATRANTQLVEKYMVEYGWSEIVENHALRTRSKLSAKI